MRTTFLMSLALTATLASLSGCALDGVEAAEVTAPAQAKPAAQAADAQEVSRMFEVEKARAKFYELPPQF